jgi:hypothetical protein
MFVVLGIQHAIQYFSTSHKRHDFLKSYQIQNVYFDFLCNFCLKHLSFEEELNGIWSKNVRIYYSSRKVPVIAVRFWWNSNFLDRFSQNTQIPNFLKILPVGDELLHADRWTDTTNLIVAFRSFTNALNDRLSFNLAWNWHQCAHRRCHISTVHISY